MINDPRPTSDLHNLLEMYPTRELKLQRIHDIERSLARWEREDEENDPTLIQGHIRLTRGFRIGCGTFWICVAAICFKSATMGHRWINVFAVFFSLLALWMIFRGLIYRPDPKLIYDSYEPHRSRTDYRLLVEEMEVLSRAMSQELRAEDEV